MATVNKYIRTANNSAAHTAVFGSALVAGTGDGSLSSNPDNDFAAVEGWVEDIATDHSADDLVIHLHPGCYFDGTAAPVFDRWTDVGRNANSWKSVTVTRWQAIVDAEPLYEDWWPTFSGCTSVASGAWTLHSGAIYKITVTGQATASPSTLRCWGGHEKGDNRATWTVAGVYCATVGDLSEEGDYTLVDLGADCELYVHSGQAGTNPTARWGYFTYTSSTLHQVGLQLVRCKGITFTDLQSTGYRLVQWSIEADGETIDDITAIRPRVRMCPGTVALGGGTGLTSNPAARINNTVVRDPDFDAGRHPTRPDQGVETALGSCNGLNFTSGIDGLWVYNPKIKGYSHGQIQIHCADDPGGADPTVYPRNCHIIVDDITDGKGVLTGTPGYSRGITFICPGGGRVSQALRITGQNTQSQVGGPVVFQAWYDNTCGPYSDPLPAAQDYNVGNCVHLDARSGVTGARFIGMKLDAGGDIPLYWSHDTPDDGLEILGCLFRDSGYDRFRPNVTTAASAAYTRRKTPLLSRNTGGAGQRGTYQPIRNSLFVLDPACEGIAQHKSTSGTDGADATALNYPVIDYDENVPSEPGAGTSDWGSRISGNQRSADPTDFGFDTNLNYIGVRKTPVQSGPQRARGYR